MSTTINPQNGDYSTAVRYLLDAILPSYTRAGACTAESLGNDCNALTVRFGDDEQFALVITNGESDIRWHVLDSAPVMHIVAHHAADLATGERIRPIFTDVVEDVLDWTTVEASIDLVIECAKTRTARP